MVVNLDPHRHPGGDPAISTWPHSGCPTIAPTRSSTSCRASATTGRRPTRTSGWTPLDRVAHVLSILTSQRRCRMQHLRQSRRPALVPAGRVLRDPGAGLLRQQRRRHRRPRRHHRQARLPPVARRRLPVVAALLPVARCATAATTSATSGPSCPSTATWPTRSSWSSRPTSGACGSSPTWS